jgi:MFS family permease
MKSGMAKANSTGPRHIGLALLISRTHSTGPHTGKERFLGGLVCTRSTNMIAPALRQSSIDLDMKPSVMQLTLSIYLLAFVFGSPVIASVSEMYGRKQAYFLAHRWYIIWNTLCSVNKVERVHDFWPLPFQFWRQCEHLL